MATAEEKARRQHARDKEALWLKLMQQGANEATLKAYGFHSEKGEGGVRFRGLQALADEFGPVVINNGLHIGTIDILQSRYYDPLQVNPDGSRGAWRPLTSDERGQIQSYQSWRDSDEGQAWKNAYGGSGYQAFERKKRIESDIRAGHLTRDPRTGNLYNVGKGDTQWFDPFGRPTNAAARSVLGHTGAGSSSGFPGGVSDFGGFASSSSSWMGASAGEFSGLLDDQLRFGTVEDAVKKLIEFDVRSTALELRKSLQGETWATPYMEYLFGPGGVYPTILGISPVREQFNIKDFAGAGGGGVPGGGPGGVPSGPGAGPGGGPLPPPSPNQGGSSEGADPDTPLDPTPFSGQGFAIPRSGDEGSGGNRPRPGDPPSPGAGGVPTGGGGGYVPTGSPGVPGGAPGASTPPRPPSGPSYTRLNREAFDASRFAFAAPGLTDISETYADLERELEQTPMGRMYLPLVKRQKVSEMGRVWQGLSEKALGEVQGFASAMYNRTPFPPQQTALGARGQDLDASVAREGFASNERISRDQSAAARSAAKWAALGQTIGGLSSLLPKPKF